MGSVYYPCAPLALQAYANVGATTPATRAFMVALAGAACERDAYNSIAQAGWALTVVDALSDTVLRKARTCLLQFTARWLIYMRVHIAGCMQECVMQRRQKHEGSPEGSSC